MWQGCCFPVTFLPGQPRSLGAVGEGWLCPKRAELISAGVPFTLFVVWGAANHPQTLRTTADSCKLLEGGLLCEKGGSEMRQPPHPHPHPPQPLLSGPGSSQRRKEEKRRRGTGNKSGVAAPRAGRTGTVRKKASGVRIPRGLRDSRALKGSREPGESWGMRERRGRHLGAAILAPPF